MNWQQYTDAIKVGLRSLSVIDGFGYQVGPDMAFQHWCTQTMGIINHRGTVYLVGNGASASMARMPMKKLPSVPPYSSGTSIPINPKS